MVDTSAARRRRKPETWPRRLVRGDREPVGNQRHLGNTTCVAELHFQKIMRRKIEAYDRCRSHRCSSHVQILDQVVGVSKRANDAVEIAGEGGLRSALVHVLEAEVGRADIYPCPDRS